MGLTPTTWAGKRVLVTGHTGFKGAWLCQWLCDMGAVVTGVSLAPEDSNNLWDQLALGQVASHIADIRDAQAMDQIVQGARPQVIFHLAAQSLVRRSYATPVETFDTNVMGTVNVLNAARSCDDLQAVVVVTTDKCYQNDEDARAFLETDPMGGHDPYSASKGAAEIATAAMRASFFGPGGAGRNGALVASGRAGNVIGGGDWSQDRIVPDILRGCLSGSGEVVIRSPNAVRPWQHVLEPLAGYLLLAQSLMDGQQSAASGWNFGPNPDQERPVIELVNKLIAELGQGRAVIDEAAANLHEAQILRLDSSKARNIGWQPALGFDETAAWTASWYRDFNGGVSASELCRAQIAAYHKIMEAMQ